MTKRTNKPKATQAVAPTINSTAPKQAVERVKVETKAKKPKQANSTAKKAPQKPRARTKKVVVEKPIPPEGKVVPEVTYVDPMTMVKPTEPKPSLYDRFVGWLFKVTYLFRGY
jgi:hypothetical protein